MRKPPFHHRLTLWTGVLLIVALLCALAPQALAAPAAQTDVPANGLSLEVRAGFDGVCKDNTWIPLRVVVENTGPAFAGELLVLTSQTGANAAVYAIPLQLASTARKEIQLAVYPAGYISELEVRLRAEQLIVLTQKVPVRCQAEDQIVMGVLAGSPSALNALADFPSSGRQATLARMQLADLPEQAAYLDALDVLLVSDLDTGGLSPAQFRALQGWLASGGQLLVTGGAGWQKSTAGLQELLPFVPTALSEISDLSSLVDFSGAAEAPSSPALAASSSLSPGSTILLSQAERILIASRPLGFGRVLYLAFDPASEPLRSWPGAPRLVQKMLEPAPGIPSWGSGFREWYAGLEAASTMPSLSLLGMGWLLVFLLLYVLAIGPLNYLILRILKRHVLAWLTIPALVVLFAGAAFLFGGRARGSQAVLSQLAIVQVWPGQENARLDGLVSFFSPSRQSYTLRLPQGMAAHPIPDTGMGGGRGVNSFVYAEDGALTLPDLQMDVAAIQGLSVSRTLPAPQLVSDLRLELVDSGARLTGKITNLTGETMRNVVLLVPGNPTVLGDISAGEVFDLAVDLSTSAGLAGSPSPMKPGPVTFYAGPGGEQALYTIVGGMDTYSDPLLFRRYNLLVAATGYTLQAGQGGGLFLSAWVDHAPQQAQASLDRPFVTDDTTLYMIALQPELDFTGSDAAQGELVTLPPALFTWSPMGGDYYALDQTPYGGYLGSTPFFFSYRLNQSLSYQAVTGLTLHLSSQLQGGTPSIPTTLDVSLWDFQRDAWVALEPLPFGDHSIAQPERFVGPGSEMRLRLENPNDAYPIQLERVDFSLQVRRSAP